jgi:hypothetical protein
MTILNKIVNIKYINNTNNFTLLRALLIFYLLIGNSYTHNLYSGQLKQYIKTNRFAQHVIALITMLVLVIYAGGVTDIYNASFYTIIIYVWFLLTTKLDLQWNIAIIALLIVGFLYESTLIDKELDASTDQALQVEDIKKIKKHNKYIKKCISLSILALTLIGSFIYICKKQTQYKDQFDINKYLFAQGQKTHLIIYQ